MKYTVKNYKCFDEHGVELGPFKDINVIIGKNNSGKSSIIDIVSNNVNKNKEIADSNRNGRFLIVTQRIKVDEIALSVLRNYLYNQKYEHRETESLVERAMEFLGKEIRYNYPHDSSALQIACEHIYIGDYSNRALSHLFSAFNNYFPNKKFSHLSAERDIQPEASESEMTIKKNGNGATNFIQRVINDKEINRALIEKMLLQDLNEIANPDMLFKRVVVQNDDKGVWEIFLEDESENLIPLSKMGSGIKTILLVVLRVKIEPIFLESNHSEYIFALEELENNLHPSQQRRLYKYLYEFSIATGAKFFITTHSNIVIDLYSRYENAQIMHVYKENGASKVKTISDPKSITTILDDLAVKASDILQSNAVIWVEGPSDRTYIKHWIDLVDSSLIEGYHYSIMFYGGRLLSNLSLDYANLENDLISLIRLNRNSFVVMDRDGSSAEKGINATKQRIVEELGEGRVWVTYGREIENYLSDATLTEWLKIGYNLQEAFVLEDDQKIEDAIQSQLGDGGPKYARGKSKFAKEIVDHIMLDNFGKHDLKPKIDLIVNMIRECNK